LESACDSWLSCDLVFEESHGVALLTMALPLDDDEDDWGALAPVVRRALK
jgi:hypothetical protein